MSEPRFGAIRHEQRVEFRADNGQPEVVDQRALVWTGSKWVDVRDLIEWVNAADRAEASVQDPDCTCPDLGHDNWKTPHDRDCPVIQVEETP